MFTIFTALECSNIHKMFAQLSTGEINKGDIIKYYKTNYDPMLELHNNFFDKCIDHLTDQELKKNHSFFAQMIDKVKDIFSQGTTYEKLAISELGVTIDCDNYINTTVSEGFISKKKEDLKKLRSSLVSINIGNPLKRMGRMRSESGKAGAVKVTGKSIADIEATLRKYQTPQSQIDSILADLRKEQASGASANGQATGASATGASASTSGASASATGTSVQASGTTIKAEGSSKTTKSTTTTIKGGSASSSASSTQTVTYDANGKKITVGGNNGSESYANHDKNYSGSTISGMGAKFSVFYDRKIITKEGKSYVVIGGVEHLIDEDGWIHGLNIDASDKKINYNIAYENYFDTSCESMLTFMKNKYTQLLADFNMNKDYVHNLQIENRRYINKVSILTKESTEINLKLNTCEQKIQGEKVKKSTLYHNIKDIKRIKVDTRIKEMQITINKLETTINNYKIEITNLKLIITNNKKDCEKTLRDDGGKCEESCKKKILDIETKCKIDIDIHINKYTKCERSNLQINIDLGKCREKNKICENSECSKKLQECKNELRIVIQKNTTINLNMERINIEINKLKLLIESYKKIEIDLKYELKICKEGQKKCKDVEERIKKCEENNISITKKYETIIIENNVTIKKCKTDEISWKSDGTALIECRSQFRDLKIKLESECKIEITKIKSECENSTLTLTKKIDVININITSIQQKLDICSSEKAKCESGKKECETKLEIDIKTVKEECEKSIKEKDEKCQKDIKYHVDINVQCKEEKRKELEQKDKECNESKEGLNKQITNIEVKYEETTKISLEWENKAKECSTKLTDMTGERDSCEGRLNKITLEYNLNITKKTVTCTEATLVIQKGWDSCKEDVAREKIKVEECKKSEMSLNIEIQKKVQIILNSTKECQKKIEDKTIEIRKYEQDECTKKVNIEINHYTTCSAEKVTITKNLERCNVDLNIYIKLKGFDKKLLKCESDVSDRDKSITTYKAEINTKIEIIRKLNIDISTIQLKFDKCEKDIKSDLLKIDLEACRKFKEEKITLIKNLKIFIDKSFLEFRLTISEMNLSYNTRIQKLLTIINSTKSQQTQIKVIIDSHIVKIDLNNTDRENYEKQISELKLRITTLIRQRTEYLAKLDTIDSTSITLITEIKKQIIDIQRDIDENNTRITSLNVIIIGLSAEINKYKGEIDVYKQNQDYYIETLEKYEEIKGSLEAYIKKLEAIIKNKTITGDDKGTSTDVSVYINNIDTQDKDIIFKMNNQIEKFEVTIKEMVRKYNEEYANFKVLLKKCEDGCNSRISIIQQEKSEMDEKCDKKINIRVTEINKSTQITIMEIRQNYRKEIIEIKKKCNENSGLIPNNNTEYSFELYKKHCMILIEKNTSDDCKAIGEVRTYYNEKCIMTSLPGSTKDLTTFASSDFTDDRNAKMMKRLNSSQ